MNFLKKINKGLILSVLVVALLVIYLTSIDKQRNEDKILIKTMCEEFIELTDKYVVLPEDMQSFAGEISKENEEKIQKQLKEELENKMVKNDEAVKIQYQYILDELKDGYSTKNQVKTKNKRTITKISNYEFDGNQVKVTLQTSTEIHYKYIEEDTGEEKEKQNTISSTDDEIILQKVDGQWKIIYSNMKFGDNSINYVDSMMMY